MREQDVCLIEQLHEVAVGHTVILENIVYLLEVLLENLDPDPPNICTLCLREPCICKAEVN